MKKVFIVGALGYGLIEILWRGRTHPSMLLAGGLCLCGIKKICEYGRKASTAALALKSGAFITGVEGLFGVVFNKLLGMNVWDYSGHIGNIAGQVCPLFTALWCLLALPIVSFFKRKGL